MTIRKAEEEPQTGVFLFFFYKWSSSNCCAIPIMLKINCSSYIQIRLKVCLNVVFSSHENKDDTSTHCCNSGVRLCRELRVSGTRKRGEGRVFHTCTHAFPNEAWNPRATQTPLVNISFAEERSGWTTENNKWTAHEQWVCPFEEPAKMCRTH